MTYTYTSIRWLKLKERPVEMLVKMYRDWSSIADKNIK